MNLVNLKWLDVDAEKYLAPAPQLVHAGLGRGGRLEGVGLLREGVLGSGLRSDRCGLLGIINMWSHVTGLQSDTADAAADMQAMFVHVCCCCSAVTCWPRLGCTRLSRLTRAECSPSSVSTALCFALAPPPAPPAP